VETARTVFCRDACRAAEEPAGRARFDAIVGLPLLKDVQNCEVGARGSLRHSSDALGVILCPRDSEAACRGSIAVDRRWRRRAEDRSGSN
jgi:hypothetical protein